MLFLYAPIPSYLNSYLEALKKIKPAPQLYEFAISKFEELNTPLMEVPPSVQKRMLGEIHAKKFYLVKNYSTIFECLKKVAKGDNLENYKGLEDTVALASKAPKSPFLNPDLCIALNKDRKFVVVNLYHAGRIFEKPEYFTELTKIILSAAQALKVLNEAEFLHFDPSLKMNRINQVWKLDLICYTNGHSILCHIPEEPHIVPLQMLAFAESFCGFIKKFTNNHPKAPNGTNLLKIKETIDLSSLLNFFEGIIETKQKNLKWESIIDCFTDFTPKKLEYLMSQMRINVLKDTYLSLF